MLGICLATLVGVRAGAQVVRHLPPTIMLATGPELPRGKRAMVLVRPAGTPREIVVVGAAATPEDLAASLHIAQNILLGFPTGLRQEVRAYPTAFVPPSDWRTVDKPRFMQYLKDVRTAKARSVEGLGTMRVIDVPLATLPPR
jgi:hypothetical protein